MLTKEERDEYRETAISLTACESQLLDDLDAKDAEIAALKDDVVRARNVGIAMADVLREKVAELEAELSLEVVTRVDSALKRELARANERIAELEKQLDEEIELSKQRANNFNRMADKVEKLEARIGKLQANARAVYSELRNRGTTSALILARVSVDDGDVTSALDCDRAAKALAEDDAT